MEVKTDLRRWPLTSVILGTEQIEGLKQSSFCLNCSATSHIKKKVKGDHLAVFDFWLGKDQMIENTGLSRFLKMYKITTHCFYCKILKCQIVLDIIL